MKLLKPLARPAVTTENRYTLGDYANWLGSFSFQGSQFPLGVTTTVPGTTTESIPNNYTGYASGALKGNGIVGTLELIRVQVFSQARFKFRRELAGRPGDLFGTPALLPLEQPWPSGTTGQLLARALLDADMAGNSYNVLYEGGTVRLRPDWVDIMLEARPSEAGPLGQQLRGYIYYEGGRRDAPGTFLPPNVVAHFAPMPDPLATYRGMSWLTPVIRELAGDEAFTKYKTAYVGNAATPNLAVSLKESVPADEFERFVDIMAEGHDGPANAGKTLYLAGGADVTVVGSNLKDLDFSSIQGAGETRLAAASGVGAVIAQFSEGLQGSALNAGNYGAARRRFADVTMRHLWQEAAGAFANIVTPPRGSTLWYDSRDIPFLQEDEKDAADIRATDAATVSSLVSIGYEPDAAVAYVQSGDLAQLTGQHSGVPSVQLQASGSATVPDSEDDA